MGQIEIRCMHRRWGCRREGGEGGREREEREEREEGGQRSERGERGEGERERERERVPAWKPRGHRRQDLAYSSARRDTLHSLAPVWGLGSMCVLPPYFREFIPRPESSLDCLP